MISVWKSAQPVNHLAITAPIKAPREMKAKGTVIRLAEGKKMEGGNRKLGGSGIMWRRENINSQIHQKIELYI